MDSRKFARDEEPDDCGCGATPTARFRRTIAELEKSSAAEARNATFHPFVTWTREGPRRGAGTPLARNGRKKRQDYPAATTAGSTPKPETSSMATNTSEISLNNDPNGVARAGAKVNLRLWSDTTSFGDVRRRIALVPEIIANKGDARKDRKGAPLNSRFGRNYVSFEESDLNDAAELGPCVANILQAVAASGYANLIKAKDLDATLWIAIFKPGFAYQGAIGESVIARASAIGVRLFIEDYAGVDDEGVPTKTWLND
jgi:hypothetical protein